jgi:Flp pilus assembly protein TadD
MEKIINQAITAHQEGRLEEAELLYRSILKIYPGHFIVLNNLSIILRHYSKFAEAEKNFKKAIELKPDYAVAHNNLGAVLKDQGRLDEAETNFRKTIELKPDYAEAHNNLGAVLRDLGRLDEAETNFRKTIELKPNYAEAHNYLGAVLRDLGRLDEAETNVKKAIELKPDYAEAHNNLGAVLRDLGRLDEAETNVKKAIELKPDYAEAHNNLGAVLRNLDRLDEVETNFRKAIELKPDYVEAHNNLDVLLKEKYLLDYICETKKIYKKNKASSVDSSVGLTSNPFITHRNVETKLLKDLYKSELIELDKIKDARYGNGRCSDFKFLESDFPIIKNIKEDLIKIIRSAVKSDIFIFSSFLNIYGPGSGAIPHNHIRNFDKNQGLIKQKYSLTYYLSVGDQNCSEPGNLQLYDPFEEIKLSNGTIVIIPATKKHGAVYGGKTDRIMIGINFYSVL